MAGRYTLQKVHGSANTNKLVYNISFNTDGFGTNIPSTTSSIVANRTGAVDGLRVVDGNIDATIPGSTWVVESNKIIDISDLEPSSMGAVPSSVSIKCIKGISSTWQGAKTGAFLVDSEGNKHFTFPTWNDSFDVSFPSETIRSDSETDANGNLYLGMLIEPNSGSRDVHLQAFEAQITFEKHY